MKNWPAKLVCLIAALVAVLAAINLLGWLAHDRLSIFAASVSVSMKFNTALGVFLCGIALLLLPTRRPALILPFAFVPGLIALLTLFEYLGGCDLRIDEFFVRDAYAGLAGVPGRMAPLTASCLLFCGAALTLAACCVLRPWRIVAAGLLASAVMIITGFGLAGYSFGLIDGISWGMNTHLNIQAAIAFFCLGAGFLIWLRQNARDRMEDLLPWLPILGAVTLMVMVASLSLANVVRLQESMRERQHSGLVIAAAQSLENKFLEAQRSVRSYVTHGAPPALQAYQQATNQLPAYYLPLVRLTLDNPDQHRRALDMAVTLQSVLKYDDLIIRLYRQQGAEAVLQYDKTAVPGNVSGQMLDALQRFNDQEQKLLTGREAAEQRNYDSVGRLLTYGSLFAAILLVLAHTLASREIRRRRAIEEVLRESEERFRSLVTGVKDYAIYMLDTDGCVASWNSGAQKIYGFTAYEIVGQPCSKFLTPADQSRGHLSEVLAGARQNGSYEEEGWRIRKNGSRFMANILVTAWLDARGALRGFSEITRDITERTRVEAALRESEDRFRRSFDDAPIGMALVSPSGRWLKVNRALCTMLGYREEELLRIDFQTITHPEDLDIDLNNLQQVLSGSLLSYQMEKRYYHKLGHVISANLSVSLVRDRLGAPLYFVSQVENITERKRVEEQIAASLKEKDVLLREIHHRVKNNMQIISSILKLQANCIHDPVSLAVFNDCQNRIRTMALVHEKLYRTEGLARIDFKDYLSSLTAMLFRAQTENTHAISHEFRLENVDVDVDTAIPLGLIANELITNALKHAFVGRQKGFVLIVLRRYDASQCQLVVKDDGHGLAEDFAPEQTRSLGLRLIRILIDQIHGRLEYKSENGAEFVVTFKNQVT